MNQQSQFALFSAGLDLMIQAMEANSQAIDLGADRWPAREFVSAFRTVRAWAGPSIGASTYIAKHARHGDVVVCPNADSRNHLIRQVEEMRGREYFPMFLVPHDLHPRMTGGRIWKTIWIDGCHYEAQHKFSVEQALQLLVREREQRVILLG